MAVHNRVWERMEPARRPWRPVGTYGLLTAMVLVFLVQMMGGWTVDQHLALFTIDTDWYERPWSLVTSTFAHGDTWHLLFNGLFLFFFGPIVERIVGLKRFLAIVLVAGALAGIAQVHLAALLEGESTPALGISGALNALFGILIVLMPNQKLLLYGILPVPFWAAGLGYALLDLARVFDPASPIAGFAHLAGLALGLLYGLWLKGDLKRRGMRLVVS